MAIFDEYAINYNIEKITNNREMLAHLDFILRMMGESKWTNFLLGGHGRAPRLDHIFIWLCLAPPTPPSLFDFPAHTCMGNLLRWEPMYQYLVKTTNIQVDITFIISKLIDGVPSHAKGVEWLK